MIKTKPLILIPRLRHSGVFLLLFSCLASADYFQLDGLDDEPKNNVELILSGQNITCSDQGVENSLTTKEHLKEQVARAIQPYGFFSPQVIVNFDTKQAPCVDITVDQGKAVRYQSVELRLVGSGLDEPELKTILDKAPISTGQIFLDQPYRDLKSDLKVAALDLGYLDAAFTTAKVDVYPEDYRAEVTLVFDTGLRYAFESIQFELDEPTMEADYLAKMIELRAGDWVESEAMVEARERLIKTRYFSSSFFELNLDQKRQVTEAGKTIGLVPLKIRLFNADRMKHAFKVGYSTDTGPRAGYSFNHYRINQYGDQVRFDTTISQLSQDISINLMRPSRNEPTKVQYNFALGYQREQSPDVVNETYLLGINQTREVTRRWDNMNYIDLSYQVDDYGDRRDEFWLLVPGVTWDYTQADNLVRPRDALKWHFNVQGALEDVVSDTSFAQINIENRLAQGLFRGQRVITRVALGHTWVEQNDDLPSSYRYLTGGDKTVRGYAYESIGPNASETGLSGGKSQVVASVEYEVGLYQNWALAGFYDIGSAFDERPDFHAGTGFGVRWFSPVGPIKLDLGFPLAEDADNDYRLHFVLGTDF
ncbi:MAG: BamA/TamA family outer membrane protein [Pseudomonadota bacterium]|nr:BamA/TamA family outer membrane protein [Pseudomonadota bacterium]